MSIISCVPNVSEGRRREVIQAISDAVGSVRGVRLLDATSDYEMNRTVMTFLGNGVSLRKAVHRLMQSALDSIDISKHRGKHPRMGIVDVIPFVPVGDTTMEQCVKLARQVGKDIADSFGVPVYLYEQAATGPERVSIDSIRDGEFEGFSEKMKRPEWRPDFGPARVHPTAGVVAVGARPPLHALNIELATGDVELAGKVAEAVRRAGGEPKRLRTLVVNHGPHPRVRLSVSVVNHRSVPLYVVVEAARKEAQRLGVEIAAVELVGLIVTDAILDCLKHYLQLELDPAQILELHLPKKR
jgi:glutamate formiminotransferase